MRKIVNKLLPPMGKIARKILGKLLSLYFVVFFFIVYVPIFVLMVLSFNDSLVPGLPLLGFTTKWYEQFLSNPSALQSILNTVIVGLTTAFLATLGGMMAAFALVRHKFPLKSIFNSLILIPMVLPYILMGVSISLLFQGILRFELSLVTVAIGHTLVALPFSTLTMVARLTGFDRSLEEAAMDLGADELTTFRKVTLPLIMPGIIASAFLAFTTSFEDVTLAYFLGGFQQTLPMFIYGQLRYATSLPMLTALSVTMLSFSFVLAFLSSIQDRL